MAAPKAVADLLAKAKGAAAALRSAASPAKRKSANREAEEAPFAGFPAAEAASARSDLAVGPPRPSFTELRYSLAELLRKPLVLAVLGTILLLVLAMAATAIVVGLPPRPGSAPGAAVTKDGEELLRRWLLPPGDPLEPTMPMEREGPEPSAGAAARNFERALADQNRQALSDKVDAAVDSSLEEAP